MTQVVIRDLANADVESARAWYAGEDERLGARLLLEFTATVDRIRRLPDQFPEVGRGVRRALLHRFPYAVYFVRREELVIVVALLHQHRRPGIWRSRVKREESG